MHCNRAWQRLWRVTLLSLILANSFVTSVAKEISFNRDVRPILSANCFSCHGPDKKARKAKLRLDTREGALFDLGGYRALEPGKADDSELILRIETNDPDDRMPPPDSGHELTAEDRRVLREWVNAGGEYDVHWSFKRPVKAP
ncbi:MAG: c-type cytochrome domain-containing protein, partial [Opitutales bacterium]